MEGSRIDNIFSSRTSPYRPWNSRGRLNNSKWNKAIDTIPLFFNEPVGFWEIFCDCIETDTEGLTEMDRAWAVAKELAERDIFIQACYKDSIRGQATNRINCFVGNYLDVDNVIRSAAEFRKRFNFPAIIYMKSKCINEIGETKFIVRYQHCCDGDLYECVYGNKRGFKLIQRNSTL